MLMLESVPVRMGWTSAGRWYEAKGRDVNKNETGVTPEQVETRIPGPVLADGTGRGSGFARERGMFQWGDDWPMSP